MIKEVARQALLPARCSIDATAAAIREAPRPDANEPRRRSQRAGEGESVLGCTETPTQPASDFLAEATSHASQRIPRCISDDPRQHGRHDPTTTLPSGTTPIRLRLGTPPQ